jgi:hypothetical protein
MENQINNLQELEELRSQVAEFKNRIEKQEIVSRHLLNEAMKGHVSWIKHMSIWGGILDFALVPLVIYALHSIVGVSWPPVIFICLVLVVEGIFNFWNVSTIRDKHLVADDVLSAQQRLTTFKRREKLYTFGVLPFILIFFVWLLFDVYHGTDIPYPPLSRLIVYFVVIAVTLAAVFYVFYREMRSLNKAIKEIDEFNKSTE